MPTIQGQVGAQLLQSGSGTYGQGLNGDLLASGLHGKYAEATRLGRTFFGSSASGGIALIVPATGGGHPTLWNPSGSNVNLSIIRLEMGWVSGNNAPGAIEWATTANTGAQAATGSPILTATLVAPTSALIGGTGSALGRWSPTTNTFTAAPSFARSAGLSLFTGISSTAVAPFQMRAEYDGDFQLAPGNAVSLCFQTTTTTAVFQITVVWEEIPIA